MRNRAINLRAGLCDPHDIAVADSRCHSMAIIKPRSATAPRQQRSGC
jgi:hypothetical protein